MRNCLAFLAFFLPFGLSAQFFQNFANTAIGPCPFDPTVEVTLPENWEIYQTIDDKWDSPVDSSKCFTVEDVGNEVRFFFDEVGGDRPLFIRAKFDPQDLTHNKIHELFFHFDILFAPPTLKFGTDCANGLCSGLLLGIEIPDEPGTGTTTRWYPFPVTQTVNGIEVNSCFPTERFPESKLKEIIVKLTLDDNTLEGNFYEMGATSIFEAYDLNWVPEIVATPVHFNGSEYDVHIAEFGGSWSSAFLFPYLDSSYPSAQNLSYVDARIEPNSIEKETINLYVSQFESIYFQPFTELRGGLVEGDTIERHTLNLVNEGGEFCFSFIELIFDEDTHFLQSGDGLLDFNTPNSCMMFRHGGSLQILDGATLEYGHGGTGILAVGSDAEIILGENSSFHLDNQFMLIDAGGAAEATLDIFLRPGQTFSFGENAHLFRSPWNERPMFVDVHLLGGTLDISKLDEEEKALIRLVHPPVAENFADNVRLFPNPSPGAFSLEINLPQAEKTVAEVMDLNGRVVFRKEEYFPQGIHVWELDGALGGGVYFVKISSGGNSVVEKMLVY